jgi:hypothetical protein
MTPFPFVRVILLVAKMLVKETREVRFWTRKVIKLESSRLEVAVQELDYQVYMLVLVVSSIGSTSKYASCQLIHQIHVFQVAQRQLQL